MLRSINTKSAQKSLIPTVVHQDGTCRIQTVRPESNPTFHALLQAFHELTGVPLLLNTSLNLGGKPIVASRQQCVDFFGETDLDAIVMGNDIYRR